MQESIQAMNSKDLHLLYNPPQFQEHDPQCEECTAKKKKNHKEQSQQETYIYNQQSDPKTHTTVS